jgi:hypothetical protein
MAAKKAIKKCKAMVHGKFGMYPCPHKATNGTKYCGKHQKYG